MKLAALILFEIFVLVSSSKSSRINGGSTASSGQFPFAAAIYKETMIGTLFCVGSLLNTRWILTSAQCVDGALDFEIVLGSNNLDNVTKVKADQYVPHPLYNPLTLENDIGLIRLAIPVSFSENLKPVDALPIAATPTFSGALGLGWGQFDDNTPGISNVLRYVHLTSISNEECRAHFGQQIKDTMMCVEGNQNSGPCRGDNGGPLVQYIGRDEWMQIGVSSFISNLGCETHEPSGYTRVYSYNYWIRSTAGLWD